MQQSKKLLAENEEKRDNQMVTADPVESDETPLKLHGEVTQIRPIPMFNEWIAILQDHRKLESNIQVKQEELARPEGIVVGVPIVGMPDGAGGRIEPQVKIGDRVAFQARSILQGFTPAGDSDSPYRGKHVIIISERNIIYRMPPVPFEIVE